MSICRRPGGGGWCARNMAAAGGGGGTPVGSPVAVAAATAAAAAAAAAELPRTGGFTEGAAPGNNIFVAALDAPSAEVWRPGGSPSA